jgi:hypothetical protein
MKYLLTFLLAISTAYADTDFSNYKKYTLTDKEAMALREAIGEQMKDPDSVRFRSKKVNAIRDGDQISGCAEFNAKNSYGGYGDPSIAVFTMSKGGKGFIYPIISKMDAFNYQPSCIAQEMKWRE